MARPFNEFGGWLRFFAALQVFGILILVLGLGTAGFQLMTQGATTQRVYDFFSLIPFFITGGWILSIVRDRDARVPRTIAILMIVALVVGILDPLIEAAVVGGKSAIPQPRGIYATVIWVWYFCISKRVLAYYGAHAFKKPAPTEAPAI